MNQFLQSLFSLTPSLDIRYEILSHPERSGYCLRVQVEKSASVCKTSDGAVYVRQGAQSIPVKDPDRIVQLSFAKEASSFEDQEVSGVRAESIVESSILNGFLKAYSPRTDALDFVLNQNLLDQRSWIPRVASVLLFHESPQAHLPRKSGLRVTRYETREDDPERDHLKESIAVEGPSYHLIRSAIEATTKIMSEVAVWTPDGIGTLDYPPEALWEHW
jgi:ATP-dependent DNA helicase RecG